MTNMLRRAALAALFYLFCQTAWSQPLAQTILAGPAASFGGGLLLGNTPVYAGSADCGSFESGGTTSWRLGGRLLLPGFVAERTALTVTALFERLHGTFEALPVDMQVVRDPSTGELVTLDRRYRLEHSLNRLQIDMQAAYDAGHDFDLSLGPSIGFQFGGSSLQTDNVLGPGNLRLTGGQSSVAMKEGVQVTYSPVVIGYVASVARRFPAGKRATLTPEISLRGNFNSPARQTSWHSLTVAAGGALLFDITPHPEPPPPVVEAPPPAPKLNASIALNMIDDYGAKSHISVVRASEVFYRRYTPLLPLLFFDHDSASIPSRYLGLPGSEPDRFSLDALREYGALDIHYYNLSILGAGLRRHPAANIKLTGMTSADEAPELARRRARAVARYLKENWGIDSSRISLHEGTGEIARSGEGSDDGRSENRRVEFASNDPAVLAPIPSDRVVRDFDPPTLSLEPTVVAEAGIKQWSMTIRQGGRALVRFGGDSGEVAMPRTWTLPDNDSLNEPIRIELTIEDSTGATTTATDEIPVVVDRQVRLIETQGEEQADRTSYALVAFGYNSAEPNAGQIANLASIAAGIPPGTNITVTGYTDRIGSEGSNIELSKRRAERVAQTLRDDLTMAGIAGVRVVSEAGGIDTERFGNNTPEGRILSRGVLVVIEHPRGE